jgi:acyl carrier protein
VTADAAGSGPVSRAEVLALVQGQLAEILERSPSDIPEDADFETLGADSLALIELVEAIEESLSSRSEGFRIDDEDLERLTSVRLAVDYVTDKLQTT